MPGEEHLDRVFSALAHPARRAILGQLSAGEATVGDLAGRSSLQQPAISKHLATLERAGLVHRSRDAQWKRCRLTAEPLKEAFVWLGDYRRFWDESLDRLDAHLRSMMERDRDEPFDD